MLLSFRKAYKSSLSYTINLIPILAGSPATVGQFLWKPKKGYFLILMAVTFIIKLKIIIKLRV